MLKIPVQYVISETEEHTPGRTTKAPKTKVSLVKGARIVVLALALGSMLGVKYTSSPREGGVPFPMVELLLVCFAEAAKGWNKSSDEYL